jgi:hypothetical protein
MEPPLRKEREGYDYCPNARPSKLMHSETGELLPAPCQLPTCPHCGPLRLHYLADAVETSHPEVHIVLTLAPTGFDKIKQGIKGFAQRLRRLGHEAFQYVFVRESNPRDTGSHLHLLAHGCENLDEATVQEIADLTGFGTDVVVIPFKKKFRTGWREAEIAHRAASSKYLFKTVIYKPLRSIGAAEAMETHLIHNDGRAEHHSRMFYRDPDGKAMTATDAVRAARPSTPWRRVS